MKTEKDKLKELARFSGSDLVGVGPVERMNEAPPGHKPTDYLPDAKYIIAAAVRMNYSSVEGLPKSRREYVNANSAAIVRLNNSLYEVANTLEDK